MVAPEYSRPAQAVATTAVDDPIAGMLIGQSHALLRVIETIRKIVLYPDSMVLIQGESGTGKDVVARAIYKLSLPASPDGLFVPINCAAIPETLLESELFGVEAGAFTDAKVLREGLLSRADRGILFLDEIGSMPLILQAKLLRFLESRSFRRLGGTKELHVKLRIISATNADLKRDVERQTFRRDLFYRLNVFPIFIPPLRERHEDIAPLIEHFLSHERVKRGTPLRISEEAWQFLLDYSWPGNVRELQHVVELGGILCDDNVIQVKNLLDVISFPSNDMAHQLTELLGKVQLPAAGIDLPALLRSIEGYFIQEALKRSGGNQVRAASLLGMSRDKLRYRLPG